MRPAPGSSTAPARMRKSLGDTVVGELIRTAWDRWKIIGEVYGDFQGRLFAVLFYCTIFVPFAVGVRLFSDPLHLRRAPRRWLDRAPVVSTLDEARKQF